MADATAVDWSDLLPELLQTTATKLPAIADYIRFHAVCKTWRAAAPISPSHLPREFPWLMLPMSSSSNRRPFFKPLTNNLHCITLPEASHTRRRAGSSLGWLILIDESPSIFLINPLTRDKITLRPLSSFPNVTNFDFYSIGREYTLRSPENELYFCSLKEMRDSFIKKVILSHSPYNNADFSAFAILNRHENLAYCKNGYDSWRIIDEARSYSEDVIYFGGDFYAVDRFGSIAICDVNDSDLSSVKFINIEQQIDGDMKYLVDAMGDLLLVSRYLEFEIDIEHYLEVCKTVEFRMFRFDWDAQKWESITSLDDKVLFLGENSSLALLASDYTGCKGNRICFTEFRRGIMIILLGIMILVFITWPMGVSNPSRAILSILIGQFGSLRTFAKQKGEEGLGAQATSDLVRAWNRDLCLSRSCTMTKIVHGGSLFV